MEKSAVFVATFERAREVLTEAGFDSEIAETGACSAALCADRRAVSEEIKASVENMTMVAGLPLEPHSS